MAMQCGALRDALVEAGASPERAAKAAEEVAALRYQPTSPASLSFWRPVLNGLETGFLFFGIDYIVSRH